MSAIVNTTPKQAREYLRDRLEEMPEIATAFAYEPEILGELPCATMLLAWINPAETATGPRLDCTYTWWLRLYVGLSDWQAAQEQLEELIPAVLSVWRDDPTLGDLIEWFTISDSGEPPMFNAHEKWLRKALLVRAVFEDVGR